MCGFPGPSAREPVTFDDYWSITLYNVCQFGFIWCFLFIRFRLWVFGRIILLMMIFSATNFSTCWSCQQQWMQWSSNKKFHVFIVGILSRQKLSLLRSSLSMDLRYFVYPKGNILCPHDAAHVLPSFFLFFQSTLPLLVSYYVSGLICIFPTSALEPKNSLCVREWCWTPGCGYWKYIWPLRGSLL